MLLQPEYLVTSTKSINKINFLFVSKQNNGQRLSTKIIATNDKRRYRINEACILALLGVDNFLFCLQFLRQNCSFDCNHWWFFALAVQRAGHTCTALSNQVCVSGASPFLSLSFLGMAIKVGSCRTAFKISLGNQRAN